MVYLSILKHGVISLPDVTSCDKKICATHFNDLARSSTNIKDQDHDVIRAESICILRDFQLVPLQHVQCFSWVNAIERVWGD